MEDASPAEPQSEEGVSVSISKDNSTKHVTVKDNQLIEKIRLIKKRKTKQSTKLFGKITSMNLMMPGQLMNSNSRGRDTYNDYSSVRKRPQGLIIEEGVNSP